jgi:hypothetical protein
LSFSCSPSRPFEPPPRCSTAAESATAEPLRSIDDYAVAEPLQSIADSIVAGVALIETS